MARNLLQIPAWKQVALRYRYDIPRFATEACGMSYTLQQEELFNSVAFDGSRTTVSSGHGCFAKGTQVMLADRSLINVEDVTIDHFLMGADGVSKREVLYLERGEEELYKFIFSDGTSHTYNKSHTLVLHNTITKEEKKTSVRFWLKMTKIEQTKYRVMRRTFGVFGGIELLGIDEVESVGVGEFYGFLVDGDHKFLAGDGIILHNTGKTRSAGIVALWHLICFPKSIMMFTAPQIQQLRKLVWKEIEACLGFMRLGRLAWVADHIQVLSDSVYVRGFKTEWNIFAKTAPKGNSQALAGVHAKFLFIWVDEASGVDEGIFDVVLGALSEEANRMCMTSQPSKQSGFYFDTHHKLSNKAGGVWNSIVMNSEESPLVSEAKIIEALKQYGSRDDPQYMVRVRGLFPDLANEFLVTQTTSSLIYKGRAITPKHTKYGYFIIIDVGGGIGRDDSVIAIAKVWGSAHWGETARRAEIVKIPLCKNRDDQFELTAVIQENLIEYPNATVILDANGAGTGLGQHLKSIGIHYKAVNWGGQCFSNALRRQYVNKRAQAYVCLSRAVNQGRFKVRTALYKNKILDQITKIPYSFDDQARFKIMAKEEMKRKGIRSPDIIDTFAFIFLEGFNYTAVDRDTISQDPESYEHGNSEANQESYEPIDMSDRATAVAGLMD